MSFRRDRLVALRKEKGYKQTGLASAMGLSRSTVAMWEAGRSDPTAELVAKLAQLFGCSVGYLMGTEEEINAQRRLDEMHAQGIAHLEKNLEKMKAQQAREELAEDPDRKALLNLARYGSAQDVKQVAALIDALRATNPDFYDGDDPA